MRFFIFIFILLCNIDNPIFSQRRVEFNFKVDGVDRNFVVAIPSGNIPTGGYPLVMMLHGTSGDGEKFYNISGWKELGEREKFISVFPSSLEYCFIGVAGFPSNTSKWNNGEAQSVKCLNRIQDFKDDVKFLRLVMDTLKKSYNLNPSKLYLSGFSNGSVMANKLAIEMSDIFSAVASNAGFLSPADSAKPKRYIPVWQTLGTGDDLVAENLGFQLPFNDSLDLFIIKMTHSIRGAENISQEYKLTKTNQTYTYLFDKPNSTAQKNNFLYTYIKDMEHIFPNGLNFPLSAPQLYWDFFQKASNQTTPLEVSETAVSISAYPNPAFNEINFRLPFEKEGYPLHLAIYNQMGQLVLNHKAQINGPLKLDIRNLTKGIYIAKLHFDHHIQFARFCVQ